MNGIVDSVIIFRILKKLTTPWEKTKAYEVGLIDKKGKILVKKNDRTPEQKSALTLLDKLVFNLKRLLQRVPGGGSQIASYVAALALIQEYVERETNQETRIALTERLEEYKLIHAGIKEYDLSTPEGYMEAFEDIYESSLSGAAFGGAMSGAGSNADINATGRAGVDGGLFSGPKPKKNIRRRMSKILDNKL